MIYVYKNTTSTFSGTNVPSECIEITEEQYNLLCNHQLTWQNNELVENIGYLPPNYDNVTLIGVTGSYGKTSVCEYIYQYLLALNKKVLMISTNGLFVNGETIRKDFMGTSFPLDWVESILIQQKEENNIEYAVIEVKGELFLDSAKYLNFDIIGLTNFHENLVNNFNGDVELYRSCKNAALLNGEIALVPSKLSADFYHTDTYEYLTEFKDFNIYEVENVSLAIEMLKKLNLYTLETFPEMTLRGRFEKYGNVIVDTGWSGFNNIYPLLQSQKIKLIYIPIWSAETSITRRYREQSKEYLGKCEKIYVTSAKNEGTLKEFKFKYLPTNYSNVEYISDHRECYNKAIAELQEDEVLFIMTREYYREFRSFCKGE